MTDKKLERFVDTFMAKLDDHLNKLDKQYQKVELLDHHMQSSFKEVVQALKDEMVEHVKSLERASPPTTASQHRQLPPPSQPLPTTIEEVEVEDEEDESVLEDEEEDEEDEEETVPKEDDTPTAQVEEEMDSRSNDLEGTFSFSLLRFAFFRHIL